MAKTGILIYDDVKGYKTRVTWVHPDPSSIGTREYCGTNEPLTIKWAGDRYGTASPSSATIGLLIRDNDDINFLKDIFDGGYRVVVEKEVHGSPGIYRVFWRGQVTSNLAYHTYKNYPFTVSLNCNDGLKIAEEYQFLMIDFPEPWPAKVSLIELLGKFIDLQLYPNNIFTINVATRLYHNDAESTFDETYIDPRVFMESDNDEYISFGDVIFNLLGPLNARLIQWEGQWWVLANDALYDGGRLEYTVYSYDDGEITNDGTEVKDLGILDLYSCSGTTDALNYGSFNYLPAWHSATIKQSFQINNNLLPFANRTGSFYAGSDDEDGVFVPLEFKEGAVAIPPTTNDLRHWSGTAPNSPKPGVSIGGVFPNYKWNAGAVWMAAVKEDGTSQPGLPLISKTIAINDDCEFSRLTLSFRTIPTYKGIPNATEEQFKYKKWFQVRYTDKLGTTWYLWNRWEQPADDRYVEWTIDGSKLFRTEDKEISVDVAMPNNLQEGGSIVFQLWQPRDENGWNVEQDFGVLFYNMMLGITSSEYIDKFVWEEGYNRDAKIRRWTIAIQMALSGGAADPALISSLAYGGYIDEKTKKNIGANNPLIRLNATALDFAWDNDIQVNINSDGEYKESYEYIWGLSIPGVNSFHELTLSSPYDISGNAIELFNLKGEADQRTLMDWKALYLIADNLTYTGVLSGSYRTYMLNPFQLVSDLDNRLYRFIGGTWEDKSVTFRANFVEFKEYSTPPPGADFNNDFNIDFFITTP